MPQRGPGRERQFLCGRCFSTRCRKGRNKCVGIAECEEVRRGVEEADRRAGGVELTPELDELPDTGLIQDEATEEGRISKGLKAPWRVTQAEREGHERTRIPYRCWCDVCVKGRGRRMAHRSKTEADTAYDDGTPRICMDYFYMNGETVRSVSIRLLSQMTILETTMPALFRRCDGCCGRCCHGNRRRNHRRDSGQQRRPETGCSRGACGFCPMFRELRSRL